MERSAWTDERLDDRFDHIDAELRALRVEIAEQGSALRGEIAELGSYADAARSPICARRCCACTAAT